MLVGALCFVEQSFVLLLERRARLQSAFGALALGAQPRLQALIERVVGGVQLLVARVEVLHGAGVLQLQLRPLRRLTADHRLQVLDLIAQHTLALVTAHLFQ